MTMDDMESRLKHVEEIMASIQTPARVEPPEDLLANVRQRIEQENNTDYLKDIMRWAAIALLVLMNGIAYFTTLSGNIDDTVQTSEIDVDWLVEEYGLNEYPYDEYTN